MKAVMFRNVCLSATLLVAFPVAAASRAGTIKTSLTVAGDVEQSLSLGTEDLAAFPRTRVEVKDKTGVLRQYEGVLVSAILAKAKPVQGVDSHGADTRFVLLVEARDGYATVFSIAEASPDLASQPILLADKVDGQLLNEEEGPLRIIVPNDRKPQRWVKQVQSIKVKFF